MRSGRRDRSHSFITRFNRQSMILSHRYRYLFLKTNKTAGTSIEIALSKFCGPDDIITPISPEDEAIRRRLVFAEFAQEHVDLYAQHAALYRPRTAEIIAIGRSVSTDELLALRDNILALRSELEGEMDAAGIDLWACPAATGPAPEGLHATGDPAMNLPWTHAGLPAITLPAGRAANGLPLGLQLVGRFAEDETLLDWADRLQVTLLGP